MAMTQAQKNRAMRQEGLREFLSNQKLIEKVLDNIEKMEKLSLVAEGDDSGGLMVGQFELAKLKTANEHRFKLIDKYVPTMKATEHSVDPTDSVLSAILKEISGKTAGLPEPVDE